MPERREKIWSPFTADYVQHSGTLGDGLSGGEKGKGVMHITVEPAGFVGGLVEE